MARINLPPLTRAIIVIELCLSLVVGALKYRTWVVLAASNDNKAPVIGSAASVQLSSVQFFTVVPALSIFYPWTFVTAAFVEQNIFTLLVTAVTFFYGGKYLERAWGSREFGKFLLVCALAPNMIAFAFYIIWAAATNNLDRSFTVVCGGFAFQAGFLVAFKQLVPEHTVTLFKGMIKMRVKHFPAIFLISNLLSGIILGTDVAATLSLLGFLSSWTFLRFYKTSYADLSISQSSSLRGDASETFAFSHFFPDSIQPPVAVVTDGIFELLVMIRVCTPFSDVDIEAGNLRAAQSGGGDTFFGGGGGHVGGSSRISAARQEAERRRALALKALDQRLHAVSTNGRSSTPSGGSGTNTPGNHEMLGNTSLTPERDEDGLGRPGNGPQ